MDVGPQRNFLSGLPKMLSIGTILVLIVCLTCFVPPFSSVFAGAAVFSRTATITRVGNTKLPLFGDLLSKSFQDRYYFNPIFDPFKDGAMGTSQYGQDHYAWNNFFYHLNGGSFLEIGGHDGLSISNTAYLERTLSWKGILVEPRPHDFAKLRQNRPNATSLNAAVCNASSTLHFVEADGVGGILEFMTEKHKDFFKSMLDLKSSVPIPCIPMSSVFDQLGINHINFFSLDVEGAELSVLQTIDFDKMAFDVIVIESDGTAKDREADIKKLLASFGYHSIIKRDVDIWYVREGYHPSVNPSAEGLPFLAPRELP